MRGAARPTSPVDRVRVRRSHADLTPDRRQPALDLLGGRAAVGVGTHRGESSPLGYEDSTYASPGSLRCRNVLRAAFICGSNGI